MAKDMNKGIPMASAPSLSMSLGGADVVKNSATAATYTSWYLVEVEVDGKKVIPLRKNVSTAFDKAYIAENNQKGAIGYCENGEKGTIEIKAKFSCSSNPQKADYYVEIRGPGSTLLGRSSTVKVEKKNKVYTFIINDFVVKKGFYQQQLYFSFRYVLEGSSNGGGSNLAVPFYNLPLEPQAPWSINKKKKNNPWTDVLDLLLDKGKTVFDSIINFSNQNNIAIAITKIVNSKLGLVYESDLGMTVFGISKKKYLLTDFLAHMKKNPEPGDRGRRVNCTDCACAVTTFANLLGCDLYNIDFGKTGGFFCNKILTLRSENDIDQKWDYPFSDGTAGGFGYHEICMTGNFTYTSKIYDACLKVNKNVIKYGQDQNRSPLLPANTRFSTNSDYVDGVGESDDQYYIEWLIYNTKNNFNKAKLYSDLGRRSIK